MRHSAREQTRTNESKPKRGMREPEQNGADENKPEHVHRSLDHVIGVRIPASQPISFAFSSVNWLLGRSLRRRPSRVPLAGPRRRIPQCFLQFRCPCRVGRALQRWRLAPRGSPPLAPNRCLIAPSILRGLQTVSNRLLRSVFWPVLQQADGRVEGRRTQVRVALSHRQALVAYQLLHARIGAPCIARCEQNL